MWLGILAAFDAVFLTLALVDVRAADDGVIDMKAFGPVAVLAGLMLAASPFMIAGAPYESTMGLVQKIFYFHVPSWFAMFTAIRDLRRRQHHSPVQEQPADGFGSPRPPLKSPCCSA